ncbi:MAG: hypothetical protein AAF467_20725 [Actinomycetota bacterium]
MRAVAITLVVLAVLIAPPLVLVAVAGDPRAVLDVDWSVLADRLSAGQIESGVVVGTVAAVGWLAWAWFAVGVALQTAAALRGAPASAVRGIGATQWLAGRLVAQWALAGSVLVQSTAASAAPLPPLPAAVATASAAPVAELDPGLDRAGAEGVGTRIVVARKQSLIGLAEQHLGAAGRWEELRDMNVGRTMRDGTVLAADFTRIEAGWDLIVPDGPRALATLVEVAEGDNLWRLSAATLDAGREAPTDATVAGYVHDVVADNDALIDDPNLIYPGQVFRFRDPGIGSSAPPAPSGITEGSAPSSPGEQATPPPLGPRRPSGDDEPDHRVRVPVGGPGVDAGQPSEAGIGVAIDPAQVALGAAGALLVNGALRTLMRRRRFRLAHRAVGTVAMPPHDDLAPFESALHHRADGATARWIEAAIGSLGSRPLWEGESVAQPMMVRTDDHAMEVEFERGDTMAAPLPWEPTNGHITWRLDRSVSTEDLPAPAGHRRLPTVVTAAGGVLVNLEAIGLLRIDGPRRDVILDVVRSLVHELATSVSAPTVDVRTTFAVEGVDGYGLVRRQAAADIEAELDEWLSDLRDQLYAADAANAFAQRLATPDEPLGPVVVVTDHDGVGALSSTIAHASAGNLPVAVIAVGAELDTPYRIEVEESRATVAPWGATGPACRLSAREAAQLGALMTDALAADAVPLDSADRRRPVEARPPTEVRPVAAGGPDPLPAGTEPRSGDAPPAGTSAGLVVRVLGEIDLVGDAPLLTSQQLSLLSFLACRGPLSRAAVTHALWDGQLVSQSRFPNLMAELRARVGRHHLPEARDGRYGVAGIGTDLDELDTFLTAADGVDDAAAADDLRAALALVRGVPFTPPAERFWAWTGDESFLAARVEAAIAEAAARLAGIERRHGDLDGARWACEQGLTASPTDEQLVIVAVELYQEMGRSGLAHRLVDSWEGRISRLECGEPSDEPRRRLMS